MADRPILFSAPMVRALLDGRKTQTRRVLKPQPLLTEIVPLDDLVPVGTPGWFGDAEGDCQFFCGYAPGERLWVREAWTAQMDGGWTIADARRRMFNQKILYRADGAESIDGWWPSIHMPREFSRLTLIVESVTVEQLQAISKQDAIDEGIEPSTDFLTCAWRCYMPEPKSQDWWNDPRESFRTLWASISGPGAWDANPWVVAIGFRVIHANIDSEAAR